MQTYRDKLTIATLTLSKGFRVMLINNLFAFFAQRWNPAPGIQDGTYLTVINLSFGASEDIVGVQTYEQVSSQSSNGLVEGPPQFVA